MHPLGLDHDQSTRLDVYTHVMPLAEVPESAFLELLGA
jgi:hypothetical protein